MRKQIIYIKLVIFTVVLLGASSCKKSYLDEELRTSRGNDFFKTDAGILQLATGAYYQVFAVPENGRPRECFDEMKSRV